MVVRLCAECGLQHLNAFQPERKPVFGRHSGGPLVTSQSLSLIIRLGMEIAEVVVHHRVRTSKGHFTLHKTLQHLNRFSPKRYVAVVSGELQIRLSIIT